MEPAISGRPHRALAWAWLLPPLLAVLWCVVEGYHGLQGQDANDYLRTARAWTAWWHGAPAPVRTEHPQGYPFLGASLGLLTGGPLVALRILSFAALLVAITVIRRTLHGSGDRVFLWAQLILLASGPFLLRHACTVMSDLPGIAWCVGVWAVLVRWERSRRWWLPALAAVLFAAAVLTRMAAVPLVLGGLATMVLHRARSWQRWALVGVGVAGLLLLAVLAEERAWVFARSDSPLAHWSPLNAFRAEHFSDDGLLRYHLPNMVYVLAVLVHPGFVPVGALVLPFFRRSDLGEAPQRIAAGMVLGYLLFIVGMPFQNDRVLLFAQPFVVVLLFPAFGRAVRWTEQRVRPVTLVLIPLVLVQLALFARAIRPFIAQERSERHWAEQVCASGAHQVYTHGMGAAIRTWCPSVAVTELWYAPIEAFEPGALMLVRPHDLREQWTGTNPWVNFQRAREQGLRVVLEGPDGWQLSEVR